MVVVFVVLAVVIVFVIAAVAIGREAGRLDAQPPRPVFDMDGKVRGMAAATLSRRIPAVPGETPTVVSNAIVMISPKSVNLIAGPRRYSRRSASIGSSRAARDAG